MVSKSRSGVAETAIIIYDTCWRGADAEGMRFLRIQLLEKIGLLVAQRGIAPPVVELDDYFVGNTQEDSIAPNQIGYGRPSLADIHATLRAIRERQDVQAVLVGIHDDWVAALEDEDIWPAGDNVYIYTSAGRSAVESWTAGLAADGVVRGLAPWQASGCTGATARLCGLRYLLGLILPAEEIRRVQGDREIRGQIRIFFHHPERIIRV